MLKYLDDYDIHSLKLLDDYIRLDKKKEGEKGKREKEGSIVSFLHEVSNNFSL